MRFLQHLSAPIPLSFQATAEVLFNTELSWELKDDDPDFDEIKRLFEEAQSWEVALDKPSLEFEFTGMLDRAAAHWGKQPEQEDRLLNLSRSVGLTSRAIVEAQPVGVPECVFRRCRGELPMRGSRRL